jgi:hypothetical protein
MTTSRKVAVWAVVLLAVAIVLAGLYGVFGPVQHVSAADRIDDACMRALRQRGVPYDQRKDRCRVRIRSAVSAAQANGYWRWRTGNELWRYWTEVAWSPRMVTPTKVVWRIDDVNCWKDYVYIVGLDITSCKKWLVNNVHYGGGTYVVSFGPVNEGGRSYITLQPGGGAEGVFYD